MDAERGWGDVEWRLRDVAVAIMPLLLVRFISLWRPASVVATWALVLLLVSTFVWMVAFPLWLLRRRGGGAGPAPGLGRALRELAWTPATVILLGLAAAAAALLIESVVGDRPAPPPNPWGGSGDPSSGRFVLLLFLAGWVAPLTEEIFFRAFVYHALRRYGVALAAIGQAALFAAVHPYAPLHLVVVFAQGLVLLGLYRWRRTLLAPMFAHGLFNVVVGLLALMPHARLGVEMERDAPGCVVRAVDPGSAAEEAGIRPGDEILAIDGRRVSSPAALRGEMRRHAPGAAVTIEFRRDGVARTVEAVLRSSRQRE